jgi:hypothetical protein
LTTRKKAEQEVPFLPVFTIKIYLQAVILLTSVRFAIFGTILGNEEAP